MLEKLGQLAQKLGNRLHAFAFGTTVALGTVLFSQVGQTCAISGQ